LRQAFETGFPKTKDAFDKFLIGCFSTLFSQSAIFLELYFLELYFLELYFLELYFE